MLDMKDPSGKFPKPEKRLDFFWQRGLTLTEVLIVVGILTIIFGFTIAVGLNFYSSESIIAERDDLVGLLRTARGQAMNDVDESNHGVYVGASQYVLFEGNSYASRKQDFDSVFPRAKGLTIAGLSEVVFNSPQGDSGASGTITMSNDLGNAKINVNNEGRIDW